MFDILSSKLESVIRKISGAGVISEKNIDDALKEIRMSLLEADVNYKVVKEFLGKIREKATGEKVLKSLTPGQQFVKIVNDELVSFLGSSGSPVDASKKPLLIMICGLQGSGKTTTAAKLANWLRKEKKLNKILLVGADTYRPAAKEQLKKLASQLDIPFYTENHNDAVKISVNAYSKTETENFDGVIFDTAGRLHIDAKMLDELKQIKKKIPFTDVLLAADAMLGQESVNVAKSFNEAAGITGIILTKTDGDARGGAALSMKYTANVPIKFMGTGEKPDMLEVFHPDRIAGRILGMGDIVSLAEKASKNVTVEEAKAAEEKFRKGAFTLDDFLSQLKQLRQMGPLEDILKMIPGAGKMGLNSISVDEKELKHIEAIILSMTPKERLRPEIIDTSRKNRIAKGCGLPPEKINKLLKQFTQMKKMMKKMGGKMGKMKPGSFPEMPF